MTQPAAPTAGPPADPPAPGSPTPTPPETPPQPTPGDDLALDPEPTPNSEAARYRVQLREAQGERDALAERLTAYQRRECEALVSDVLELPSDLFDVGQADITAFYNDDGTVNETELRAAAAALIELRPRLAKPQESRIWGQNSALPPGGKAGWGNVIGP